MHRAGPALGDAAAELRAGEAKLIPQNPEQRHVILDIHGMGRPVHSEFHRRFPALL